MNGFPPTYCRVIASRVKGDDAYAHVRLAAFRFLEEQQRLVGDEGVLQRKLLVDGFIYEGQRVPLMGQQGIFKPRLCEIPISITTVPIVEGETRPYDDAFGEDGLLRYRYRGTNPTHIDNAGLRLDNAGLRLDNAGLRRAMQRQIPLIYFHGVVPGLCLAKWPVCLDGAETETPGRVPFVVAATRSA